VLVCVGWVLLASQPGSGWQEGRIHSWSNSIGILGVVHSIGLWSGVLAFAFGVVLGLSLDGVPAPEPALDTVQAYTGPGRPATQSAADEPVAAERRETAPTSSVTRTNETAQTREQAPTR
jgi:hypothetical protein